MKGLCERAVVVKNGAVVFHLLSENRYNDSKYLGRWKAYSNAEYEAYRGVAGVSRFIGSNYSPYLYAKCYNELCVQFSFKDIIAVRVYSNVIAVSLNSFINRPGGRFCGLYIIGKEDTVSRLFSYVNCNRAMLSGVNGSIALGEVEFSTETFCLCYMEVPCFRVSEVFYKSGIISLFNTYTGRWLAESGLGLSRVVVTNKVTVKMAFAVVDLCDSITELSRERFSLLYGA